MSSLTWLGHSAVHVQTNEGFHLYVDPWITQNPLHPTQQLPDQADVILVTHDHFDHIADVVPFSNQTGAKVVAQPETIARLQQEGLPEQQGVGMNIGGTVSFDQVQAQMVQAFHSSATGTPSGYIMTIDNQRVYHLGDNGLFGDLQLFGQLYPIDIALIPVGGHFTMDYKQGAVAANLLQAKKVIPIHYKTFPLLLQDAQMFVEEVAQINPQIEVVVLEAGETIQF